jgi:hypothetical protein
MEVWSSPEEVKAGPQRPEGSRRSNGGTCKPRVSPARGPPQAEFDLDQTPVFDLEAPEPIPEYEFDQCPPHDWDA